MRIVWRVTGGFHSASVLVPRGSSDGGEGGSSCLGEGFAVANGREIEMWVLRVVGSSLFEDGGMVNDC